jgi:hypothetical protein
MQTINKPNMILGLMCTLLTLSVSAAPAIPTAPNATLMGMYIDLTWSAVTGASNYQVEYTETAVGTGSRDVGNTTLFQQNIVPGRSYKYRLKACDASGCSAFSAYSQMVNTPLTPAQPSKPTATLQGLYLDLTWPATPGATYYTVEPYVGGTPTGQLQIGNTTLFQQNVTPGKNYQYLIKACNSSLCSPYSPASNVVYVPLAPDKTPPPTASVSGTTVSVSWAAQARATYYVLEPYENGNAIGQVNTGSSRTHSFTGQSGATYQFLLKACNSSLCSPYSDGSNVVSIQNAKIRVTATANTGGSISPGYIDVTRGSTASFTVAANAGYTIDNISGCGTSGNSSPFTTGSITSACTVIANFKPLAAIVAPTISPNGGSHSAPVSVSLSTTTAGAQIRYTTNGSDVTASSALYSAPFLVSANTTVKAKSFKAGMADSVQATANFVIQQSSVQVIYLHTDALGSVIAETDANGKVIKRTEYKPFGESKDN